MIESQFNHIIGITGGIGSGKSIVSRILRLNGLYVFDCDFEARKIMCENKEVVNAIKELLGSQAYNVEGIIDKKFISQIIFNDINKRISLNRIVHTEVKNIISGLINNGKGERLFIESAILFSSGLDTFCHEIIFVESDEETRIKRIHERNGLNEEEIRKIMKSQEKEKTNLEKFKVTYINNDEKNSLLLPIIKKFVIKKQKNEINYVEENLSNYR